jgi:hypothetical protein
MRPDTSIRRYKLDMVMMRVGFPLQDGQTHKASRPYGDHQLLRKLFQQIGGVLSNLGTRFEELGRLSVSHAGR